MPSRSHNAKKPKLAHQASSPSDADAAGLPGAPEHHLTFAQHQHGQQAEAAHVRLQQEPPQHHLKSDAQEHQQKSGGRR